MSAPESLRTSLVQLINLAEPQILARGKQLLSTVTITSWDEDAKSPFLEATVRGTERYHIVIGKGMLDYTCTCPYYRQNGCVCKHIVATALVALRTAPKSSAPAAPDWMGTVKALSRTKFLKDKESVSARPGLLYRLHCLPEASWRITVEPDSTSIAKKSRPQDLEGMLYNPLLKLDTLGKEAASVNARRMHTAPRRDNTLSNMLRLLCVKGNLLGSEGMVPLTWATGLWKTRMQLSENPIRLNQVLVQDGKTMVSEKPIHLLLGADSFALSDNVLYALDASPHALQIALWEQRPEISEKELSEVLPHLQKLTHWIDLPESLKAIEKLSKPRPVLRLDWLSGKNQDSFISLTMNFQHTPALGKSADDSGRMVTFKPDEAAMHRYESSLTEILLHLPSVLPLRPHPFSVLYVGTELERLLEDVLLPLSQDAEWTLTGLEALLKMRTHRATLRLDLRSGIDWFDLEGSVEAGGQNLDLGKVLELWDGYSDSILLPDGSRALLPVDLMRLLAMIRNLDGKELRLSRSQLGLLQQVVDDGSVQLENRKELARTLQRHALKPVPEKPVPKQLVATLRPYQLEGLQWLRQMKAWNVGGILADDMGLGKTVQVIAVLCDFYANKREQRPSLIVMPTSLLHNWLKECGRFAPHLDVVIHHQDNRVFATDGSTIAPRQIVLTTYALLRNDAENWQQVDFGYAIFDESQALKNPASISARSARSLKARHRLALTGTPIENNLLDLWSQFSIVSPGLLGGQNFFKDQFVDTIQKQAEPDPHRLDQLARLTAPFYLRRTKQKVLGDLPPVEENIIWVDMLPAQRKLYDLKRDQIRASLLQTIEGDGVAKSQIKILEGLLRLRQIACDPRLVDPSSKAKSAKLALLCEKLREDLNEGHKALVFSQFTSLLHLVAAELDQAGVSYLYLDGSTRNRAELIDRFQNDPSQSIFLISLKAGGSGLNLTAADYVFHLDPWWNPAVEDQATGRAHRIGQTRKVISAKLVCVDSIEEKILRLQQSKKKLSDVVLQTDQGFVKSLDADMVRELFS